MKFFKFLTLTIVTFLLFTSCESENLELQEVSKTDLLETYTLNRDESGLYSLDLNVTNDTEVNEVYFADVNSNQYVLSRSNTINKEKYTQDLSIDGNKLQLGFVDTYASKNEFITIIDDNIQFAAKGSSDVKKLKSYNVSLNKDGTYNLSFKVNNKVDVSFTYNEDIDTYEVHLEEGKGGDNKFTRTLEKEAGTSLKIDFVNHNTNEGARAAIVTTRKPKVIIDTDGDD